MRLNESFAKFHETVQLSTLSEERINSAWGHLYEYLRDNYQVRPRDVFIQGSYANDTAVKPATPDGEYDLDIVCLTRDESDAHDAIEKLTAILSGDADLAKRLEPNESGRPCARLRYADDPDGFGFHVDIVPARGEDPQGVLEVPMRGQEGWRESAPYLYTDWCQQQPVAFARVVRFLKRWRSLHGDKSIASIVLQVLIAKNLDSAATSDAEAVASTLANTGAWLSLSPQEPPVLPNPVLPSENLSDRWEHEDYSRFRVKLAKAATLASEALNCRDAQGSHELWQQLLGDQFPVAVERPDGGAPPPLPPPPDQPDPRQQAPTGERYG